MSLRIGSIPNEGWLDPGVLVDGDLELLLRHRREGSEAWSPAYKFDMVSKSAQQIVGGIDLRIGTSQRLIMYAGQVGYGVDEIFRGHRFAARSVRLLFPLALRHHLNPLWITCNPDNFASRRTCELAGGTLMEIVPLPNSDELYLEGEREKCRYRFDLKELLAE